MSTPLEPAPPVGEGIGEWITPEIAARQLQLGPLDADLTEFLAWWIASVSASIVDRRPRVAEHVTAGRLRRQTVEGVILRTLGRILTALDLGLGMRSEDHPEVRMQVDASTAAGDYLTAADLAALTPRPLVAAAAGNRIYSLPLGAQPGPHSHR